MKAEVQKEHKWLDRLVGEWTVTSDASVAKDHPEWSESARSLGGVWVVAEGRGEMPGGGAGTTIMTLGYDPKKQLYVGTFIGSMMDYLWVYEGVVDESGKTLTLDTVGPDFEGEGKIVRYQDIVSFTDNDHRELTSRVLGSDGQWKQVMSARYARRR